jgi:hypothetical protein
MLVYRATQPLLIIDKFYWMTQRRSAAATGQLYVATTASAQRPDDSHSQLYPAVARRPGQGSQALPSMHVEDSGQPLPLHAVTPRHHTVPRSHTRSRMLRSRRRRRRLHRDALRHGEVLLRLGRGPMTKLRVATRHADPGRESRDAVGRRSCLLVDVLFPSGPEISEALRAAVEVREQEDEQDGEGENARGQLRYAAAVHRESQCCAAAGAADNDTNGARTRRSSGANRATGPSATPVFSAFSAFTARAPSLAAAALGATIALEHLRDRHTETYADRQAGRQAGRQTQTDRHRDTETQRHRDTNTQTHKHTRTHAHIQAEAGRGRRRQSEPARPSGWPSQLRALAHSLT